MADFSVVFDPMLDKERAEFENGSGGGGTGYVAGTGIGIAGGTIYTSDVPQNKIAEDRPVFSNFAATLAANTALVAVDHCNNRKNDTIEFYCEFTSFDELTLSHGLYWAESFSVKISATTITVWDVYRNKAAATYTHGLTLSSFVRVIIAKENTGYCQSTITLATAGGSYTAYNTPAYGCSDAVQAVATFACTNAEIKYIVADALREIWVIGDSYTGFEYASWASLFVRAGHNQVMFCGRLSSQAADAVLSLTNLLTVATPRYLVWAIGMNNPDSGDTVNASWLSVTQSVLSACDAKGIIPILVLCPSTPDYLNVPKNNWIKSSGRRYIDFASAVNGTEAGSTWYPGMLSQDNLHPTELGYATLARQFELNFPESVQGENNPINQGFGLELKGYEIGLARYTAIEDVWIHSESLTLQAGHAYKVTRTITNPLTLNVEAMPEDSWGLDAHIQIYVGPDSFVQTGPNVELLDRLEPDAVNNCVARFHDGRVLIHVEDHIAGYVVHEITGTTAGTLPYALTSATQSYVSFDARTNGESIDISGATASGEKHIVGNGYAETVLTGSVHCGASGVTLSNLSMQTVAVNGGTMTLADVEVPSGSTVTLNGGRIAFENVHGSGLFNLNSQAFVPTSAIGIISGVSVLPTANNALDIMQYASANLHNLTFVSPATLTTAITMRDYTHTAIEGCTMSANTQINIVSSTADVTLRGSNAFGGRIIGNGKLYVDEGTTLNFTGAPYSPAVNVVSGIIIASGNSEASCTFINSAGTSVSIVGGTYAKINNDGTTVV